jgi:hypothetical protein
VIGDRFENCFSIYRRDFLKVIGDHFSTALCSIDFRHQSSTATGRPTLGQRFNLGQDVDKCHLVTLTFSAECSQPGFASAPVNRRLHSCAFGQRLLTSRSQYFSGVKLICMTALGKLMSDRGIRDDE